MEMTWEQKFAAINALGDASLRMRAPGNWYVDQPSVSVMKGDALSVEFIEEPAPHDAVGAYWVSLTSLSQDECVVINAMRKRGRRVVRWNGYFWADYVPLAKGEDA